jgi:hypothetical protein
VSHIVTRVLCLVKAAGGGSVVGTVLGCDEDVGIFGEGAGALLGIFRGGIGVVSFLLSMVLLL